MKPLLCLLVALLLVVVPTAAQNGPTGSLTAANAACNSNNCVLYLLGPNTGSVSLQLSGTFVATVQFEATANNSTWVSIAGNNVATGAAATSATAGGVWQFATTSIVAIRARASAYTSGTVSVTMNSATAPPFVSASASVSGNSAASATGAAVPSDASFTGVDVGGNLRGVTGAARGSEYALSAQIVDAAGNQITTFGGTTDTEDNSVATGQSASLSIPLNYGFNGATWQRIRVENSNNYIGGALMTTLVSTSGLIGAVNLSQAGGTAVLTAATGGAVVAATGVVQAVAPSGLTDGTHRELSLDQTNALRVNVVSGSTGNAAASATGAAVPAQAGYTGVSVGGTLRGVTATASGPSFGMDVNVIAGSGMAISAVVPGTGATNLGKAIDTATGATDTGVLSLATRDDALSSLTPAEGDNVQLRVNSTGALWTTVSNLTTDTAVGAAVTENPVGIGGIYTATPVAVTDGQRTAILTDPFGRVSITGAATAGATTNVGNPVLTGALSGTALTALTMSPVNSGLQVSPAGRTAVVTITSSVTATGASAPTNAALVTVAAGTRVVVYHTSIQCGSTVSTAVTATMGFGAATIPAVTGKLFSMPATLASQFQGFERGAGFPNILGMGASDEDLRLTMSTPTGGECSVSVTYTTEAS